MAMDAKGMDPLLRYCAVGRQLGYAGYLTFDMITYVSQALEACGSAVLNSFHSWILLVFGQWRARNAYYRKLIGCGLSV